MLRLIGYTPIGTAGFLPGGEIGRPKFYNLAQLQRLIDGANRTAAGGSGG